MKLYQLTIEKPDGTTEIKIYQKLENAEIAFLDEVNVLRLEYIRVEINHTGENEWSAEGYASKDNFGEGFIFLDEINTKD